jgi:hypothetical protein
MNMFGVPKYTVKNGETGRPALAWFGMTRLGPALCKPDDISCRAVSDHRAKLSTQARP